MGSALPTTDFSPEVQSHLKLEGMTIKCQGRIELSVPVESQSQWVQFLASFLSEAPRPNQVQKAKKSHLPSNLDQIFFSCLQETLEKRGSWRIERKETIPSHLNEDGVVLILDTEKHLLYVPTRKGCSLLENLWVEYGISNLRRQSQLLGQSLINGGWILEPDKSRASKNIRGPKGGKSSTGRVWALDWNQISKEFSLSKFLNNPTSKEEHAGKIRSVLKK